MIFLVRPGFNPTSKAIMLRLIDHVFYHPSFVGKRSNVSCTSNCFLMPLSVLQLFVLHLKLARSRFSRFFIHDVVLETINRVRNRCSRLDCDFTRKRRTSTIHWTLLRKRKKNQSSTVQKTNKLNSVWAQGRILQWHVGKELTKCHWGLWWVKCYHIVLADLHVEEDEGR